MNIDSHQHFWSYDPQRDAWITSEMAVLQRDFMPDDLLPELKANHIAGCVAVQVDQSEEGTEFLLGLAESRDFIKGVVGWVDLCSPRVAERLEYFARSPKLRGFRHIVQSEPDDRFLLRPDFCRGAGLLKQFGFTYDILIYPRQLPAALEFVAKFPDQRLIVDHMAKPLIRTKEIEPWAASMRQLAQSANLYCKVSGLVTEADWKRWQPEDFTPYLDVVFEAFGPRRLLFGSDWPVCQVAANYAQVKGLIEMYTNQLAPQEKERIFGLNAIEFYGLNS
jgi:L-fuconolactonase